MVQETPYKMVPTTKKCKSYQLCMNLFTNSFLQGSIKTFLITKHANMLRHEQMALHQRGCLLQKASKAQQLCNEQSLIQRKNKVSNGYKNTFLKMDCPNFLALHMNPFSSLKETFLQKTQNFQEKLSFSPSLIFKLAPSSASKNVL